jgi:hypothetical protein
LTISFIKEESALRGLVMKNEPLELILTGKKSWEIRGANTNIREQIALIRSGSGLVVGICDLVGCKGPLSLKEYNRNSRKVGLRIRDIHSRLPYSTTFAWIIANPRRLQRPIPYVHPRGAIIWIKLSDELLPSLARRKK